MFKNLLLIPSFLLLPLLIFCQKPPFSRGVNLTGWFQANTATQIQFSKFKKKDFEDIKSLGCDVIRLPINLHFMTQGAPDYTLDPIFLEFLDQAVNWAEEVGIHLILDNHTFDPSTDTSPDVRDILIKVWPQMAAHFKDRSELIYYEILNEPHGISDAIWNNIQLEVVRAIRAIDQKHTIVVGPASWNSYNNLDLMPLYDDDNLIYTFHFYDPFLFTHQGASWVEPSMEPVANIPFPYDPLKIPGVPDNLRGTWIEGMFSNYFAEGSVSHVKSLIDIAISFKEERKVPVFCGEFGVFQPNSDEPDRVFWYETVRKYLEDNNISWTVWDYKAGFGIFNENSNELFEHDLNLPLVSALGLNTPPQTPYVEQPEMAGLIIYRDFIESGISESSYIDGSVSFYNKENPANGQFAISWTGGVQYNYLGFDFVPNKDFSFLEANQYAVNFLFKSEGPAKSFDLRFIDTKTNVPNDHPWRMTYRIDNTIVPFDGQWHRLHIPLGNFSDVGAWDNDQWYNSQGIFDWTKIDHFQLVAEHEPLGNTQLHFDDIQITNLNPDQTTASVNLENISLKIFPVPASDQINIRGIETDKKLQVCLMDSSGKKVFAAKTIGNFEIPVSMLPEGTYFLKLVISKRKSATIPVQVFRTR